MAKTREEAIGMFLEQVASADKLRPETGPETVFNSSWPPNHCMFADSFLDEDSLQNAASMHSLARSDRSWQVNFLEKNAQDEQLLTHQAVSH